MRPRARQAPGGAGAAQEPAPAARAARRGLAVATRQRQRRTGTRRDEARGRPSACPGSLDPSRTRGRSSLRNAHRGARRRPSVRAPRPYFAAPAVPVRARGDHWGHRAVHPRPRGAIALAAMLVSTGYVAPGLGGEVFIREDETLYGLGRSPRGRGGLAPRRNCTSSAGLIPVRAGHSCPRWTMPGMCWVHPACAGRRLHAERVRGACGCSPARARWPLRAVSPP